MAARAKTSHTPLYKEERLGVSGISPQLQQHSTPTLKESLYFDLSSVNIAEKEMGDARKSMGSSGRFPQRPCGRPMPKRGQVKVAIVVGIAHSFVSIFSPTSGRSQPSSQPSFEGWNLRVKRLE